MISYRQDIDGLRALAVLLVLGFHLKLTVLSGGHVGVDAFFVLSGFLISSILIKQIKQGNFSARKFYARRIQRLFPPLFTTILITILASSLILLPNDFERFSRSAVASLFSVSNFVFWSESGYWDVSSEIKPLLHTWSLGVEEQFYLFWPATLLLLVKFRINLFRALAVLTLTGAIFCYLYSAYDISGAFYLLPSRVFQFSLGGLLAVWVYENRLPRLFSAAYLKDLLFVLGLSLLILAGITLDEEIPYPGLFALLPTLGTLLIILAGCGVKGQGYIGRAVLENRLMIWLGQLSYSLYLVHWPIIVLYRYSTGSELTSLDIVGLVTTILAAAILLHYGIEKQFYARRFTTHSDTLPSEISSRQVFTTLFCGLLISSIAAHGWVSGGWAWRFSELSYSNEQIKTAEQNRLNQHAAACQIQQWPAHKNCSAKDNNTVLFFGNSHEPDGYNFIRAAFPQQMKAQDVVNFGTINDCKNLTNVDGRWQSDSESCQLRLDALFNEKFIKELDAIVYSSHHTFKFWNSNGWEILEDLKNRNQNIRLAVISDYLETSTPCINTLNKTGSTASCFADDHIAYNPVESSQELYQQYSGLIDLYIDRMNLLCKNPLILSSCYSQTKNGIPFSTDNHHNTLEFAQMSGKLFAKHHPMFFTDLLTPPHSDSLSSVTKSLESINRSETETQIQILFIGFLGRAANRSEVHHWLQPIIDGKKTLQQLETSLSHQPDYVSFSKRLELPRQVQQIYINLLSRQPTDAELNYWMKTFSSSKNTLVYSIIGSINNVDSRDYQSVKDYSTLLNKALAAKYFTKQTAALPFDSSLFEVAKNVVFQVNHKGETLTQAKNITDGYINEQLQLTQTNN